MQFDTDSDMNLESNSESKAEPEAQIEQNSPVLEDRSAEQSKKAAKNQYLKEYRARKKAEVDAINPIDPSRKRRPGGGRKRIHRDHYEHKLDENGEQLLKQSGEPIEFRKGRHPKNPETIKKFCEIRSKTKQLRIDSRIEIEAAKNAYNLPSDAE